MSLAHDAALSVIAARGEAEHVVRGLGHRVQWQIPPAMWYRHVGDGPQCVLGRPPKKYGSIDHIIHGTQVGPIFITMASHLLLGGSTAVFMQHRLTRHRGRQRALSSKLNPSDVSSYPESVNWNVKSSKNAVVPFHMFHFD